MIRMCENCGEKIVPPGVAFFMKIQIYADPVPPDITEEELAGDHKAEMERLIEQMESMRPQDAEDEVFESYLFTLCAVCRKVLHDEMRKRQMPFDV